MNKDIYIEKLKAQLDEWGRLKDAVTKAKSEFD